MGEAGHDHEGDRDGGHEGREPERPPRGEPQEDLDDPRTSAAPITSFRTLSTAAATVAPKSTAAATNRLVSWADATSAMPEATTQVQGSDRDAKALTTPASSALSATSAAPSRVGWPPASAPPTADSTTTTPNAKR